MTTRRSEPDDPDNSSSSHPAPGAPHGQGNARAAAFGAQILDTVRILRENTSFEMTHIMSTPHITMRIAPRYTPSYNWPQAIHVDVGDDEDFSFMTIGQMFPFPGHMFPFPAAQINSSPYPDAGKSSVVPATQVNISSPYPDESTTDDELPELESVPMTRRERRLRRRLMERIAAPRSEYLAPNPINGAACARRIFKQLPFCDYTN
ncbi:hypothetical protein C8J57DRAFT_233830 [Mycena rebaudengoi]|nr:hypothetical protein C8J57DRAFT_233830 [Mycena rebaudengoi]